MERMPLLVPLFINSLRRAEELVVAMEARCYLGSKGRTKYVQFHSRPIDWIVTAAALSIFVAAWRLPWEYWIENGFRWLS
jgi:energy-coupling factor transport system permease protein